MTNEEMERAMQFIVGQQTQFAADIHRINEVQAQFGSDIQQMKEVQNTFQRQLATLTEATLTVVGVVGRLGEAQERTEGRLSAFITYVERYMSGGNGKKKK